MNPGMDQPGAVHPLTALFGALLAAVDAELHPGGRRRRSQGPGAAGLLAKAGALREARHEAIPQEVARDFGRPR